MGDDPHTCGRVEAELRHHMHDAVNPNHDHDFRSWATFPHPRFKGVDVYVLREVAPGLLRTEVIVGDDPGPHPVGATVINRGQMRMLEMTPELHRFLLNFSLSRGHPTFFPAIGWRKILSDHSYDARVVQCITPASCRCCRLNKQRGLGPARHSGGGGAHPWRHGGGVSALPYVVVGQPRLRGGGLGFPPHCGPAHT